MRGWILIAALVVAAGCSSRYHPDNFAEAAVHGTSLKKLESDCRGCHGDDLTGGTSKVGCDGCHSGATPAAWRTNCTFCHGGVDNNTGAPPRGLDGTDHVGVFPAHTAHVTGSAMANAYDCTQCHVKAKDVLTPGHIFGNPVGGALNDFGAGLSPQATFDKTTGTCSSVYCHGTGRADDGMIAATAAPVTCGGCHPSAADGPAAMAAMSGPHSLHMGDPTGITCADCHASTTTDGVTISNKDMHINGTRDVMITATGFTYDATAHTCTGTCHNFAHNNAGWAAGAGGTGAYHPAGFSAANVHGPEMELQRQDCRGCHGTDLTGGTTSALKGPSCDGCHSGATPTAWRSNCIFCHGGGNGDTRGMPPRDPGSTNTSQSQKFIAHSKHVYPTLMSANDCTTCHKQPTDVLSMGHAFNTFDNLPNVVFTDGRNPSATYTAATSTCANLYCHGNGQGNNGTAVDGSAPMTCTSCHGADANSRAGLSSYHRDHHGGISCVTCHNATVSNGTTISDVTKHINHTKDVSFSGGGTYTASTKTCSNIGCHQNYTWQ